MMMHQFKSKGSFASEFTPAQFGLMHEYKAETVF